MGGPLWCGRGATATTLGFLLCAPPKLFSISFPLTDPDPTMTPLQPSQAAQPAWLQSPH